MERRVELVGGRQLTVQLREWSQYEIINLRRLNPTLFPRPSTRAVQAGVSHQRRPTSFVVPPPSVSASRAPAMPRRTDTTAMVALAVVAIVALLAMATPGTAQHHSEAGRRMGMEVRCADLLAPFFSSLPLQWWAVRRRAPIHARTAACAHRRDTARVRSDSSA